MSSSGRYAFHDLSPPREDMAGEVLQGLASNPKYILPKYFYDARGSELFERITDLPEYYLTRTEMALFDRYLPDIAAHMDESVCVIEYGSGSSLKIRKLLSALMPNAYVPVDISNEHLQENARLLHTDYPMLHVYPVCADFTQRFSLPGAVSEAAKLAFFPGSSIGNFDPSHAQVFLANVRETVGPGGRLLVGVDRKKARHLLEDAYDDGAGVTAEFNLNVLAHLNEVLHADFDLSQFSHVARYEADAGCIKMFLTSKIDQVVTIAGERIGFAAGEEVHTENSYKYDPQDFLALAAAAGFREIERWSDSRDWFSLYLLEGC